MKPRILSITAAVLATFTLPSCETLKDVPINVAYTTEVAGHGLTAAYSSKNGLAFFGEKRTRVSPQK